MSEVETLDDRSVARLLPIRAPDAHKGDHGTLLVIAGTLDYLGAAVLATAAGARAGAGLVCLAIAASLQPLVAARVPEAITLGLPEQVGGDLDADAASATLRSATAERDPTGLVIGPGLRPTPGVTALIVAIVREAGAPAVLDAGALAALASQPRWWKGDLRPLVLTPHPGEFARLDGKDVNAADDERLARARAAAKRWGQIVVLKGARTVVAAPDGTAAVSPFANPALATAGTGDVLAGTIGSLLAQGVAPYDAARVGVYLHGAAGRSVAERIGDAGLLASDLPHAIAMARRDLSTVRDGQRSERRLGFGERSRSA